METCESTYQRIIVVSIRRIDIQTVGMLITLELNPTSEREIDFCSVKIIYTEVGRWISVTDDDSMKPFVGT